MKKNNVVVIFFDETTMEGERVNDKTLYITDKVKVDMTHLCPIKKVVSKDEYDNYISCLHTKDAFKL